MMGPALVVLILEISVMSLLRDTRHCHTGPSNFSDRYG